MATTIITKNSSTASAVPTAGDLVQGELAVNVTDKRLFTENSGGTVVELGTNPSSLTLSGGTANGVAYLNGSKVLTTGSALVFDGTNLAIGNANPTERLEVVNSSGAATAKVWSATNTTPIASIELQRGTNATWGADGYGDYRIRNDAGNLLFQYGDSGTTTTRTTLDSSGNLLVGCTTTLNNTNSGIYNSAGASSNIGIGHNSTPSGDGYMSFRYNTTVIGSITQSGTTATLYNVTSDQRLKENIVDAPEFGSVIDSIQVRSYNWITDQTHQRAGFIAQELVTVAPEAVHQPANPDDMMAVDYSKLVPMLVKEIQSLRARVASLEA